MALVCPAGHPPGTGTTFCRLCGRDYLEVTEVVETLVPVQEPPVQAHAVVPPAPGAPPRPPGAPAPPAVVAAPPVVPAPPVAPPKVETPKPAAPEVGLSVSMPLIAAPLDPPDRTPTPVEPEPAAEDKPSKVRRELDRAALLAGVVGGFFGGAVSGAAVTYFLT